MMVLDDGSSDLTPLRMIRSFAGRETSSDEELPGRMMLVRRIVELLAGGEEVLLLGPVGIGKTAILMAVAKALDQVGCSPPVIVPSASGLRAVVDRLVLRYPQEGNARSDLPHLLRRAIEQHPAILLLDHVTNPSPTLKGFFRSIRGTGSGVAFAVDIEDERDRARIRSHRLAVREIVVPPLDGRTMRRLFQRNQETMGRRLHGDDEASLLALARGRPGHLQWFTKWLGDARYWCDGRVRLSRLRFEAAAAVARRYLFSPDRLSPP
jgi:hypothetical protein